MLYLLLEMWKRRSKTTIFGITTWHKDSITVTVTPCNDTDDLTLFQVENQRGKMVITRTWSMPRGYPKSTGGMPANEK